MDYEKLSSSEQTKLELPLQRQLYSALEKWEKDGLISRFERESVSCKTHMPLVCLKVHIKPTNERSASSQVALRTAALDFANEIANQIGLDVRKCMVEEDSGHYYIEIDIARI